MTDSNVMSSDFDTILEQFVGGGGKWQWKKVLFLIPFHIAYSIPLLSHIFTAYSPPHRCFVPYCDTGNLSPYNQSFLKFTIPKDQGGTSFLQSENSYDPCKRYKEIDHSITISNNYNNVEPPICNPNKFYTNETFVECSSYIYDKSEFTETLTTELNLVCNHDAKRRLLGSAMMMGLTFGSLIGGTISDKIGRKRTMILGIVILVPSVILPSLFTSYRIYLFFRIISAMSLVFGWISIHSWVVETFSKGHRRLAYCVNCGIGITTQIILPSIVYYNREWRDMHLWIGIISSFPLFLIFFIPESPRWLANNNKPSRANKILKDIAKGNRKVLSNDEWKIVENILADMSESRHSNEEAKDHQLSYKDMFRHGQSEKTFILMGSWVTSIVAHYALMFSVSALSGDIFINFILSFLVDIPSPILITFVIDKVGRRKMVVVFLTILGLSCISLGLLPKHYSQLIIFIFLIGKASSSVVTNVLWLYTSELYPTNLRSQSIGTISMISRIFGLSASFVSTLAVIWKPLPMLTLGFPVLGAAYAARNLPETTGKAIPETIEETIELTTNEKII